jgi:8-oxo-dGTP pyrophosphatase MutT (NUDIX family)
VRLRRNTARVLPVDPEGRVLLLHGWDPLRPHDPFWFSIGGAVEHGETLREAAARELHEEAGIILDPEQLGVAVRDAAVSFAGQEALERATIDRHGWLRPEELDGGGERPADPELPRLMRLAVTAVLGSA